jgi:ABC-type nitrate/sulfonate/bicarbonate transport system substrate-binding protein
MKQLFNMGADGSVGSDRLVICLLVALAVLCSITSLADAATKDLERVRIGYSVGGLIPFPLIVAKENRFFEQAGLDVELINIPPTIAVTALISGDIQYVTLPARRSTRRCAACRSSW